MIPKLLSSIEWRGEHASGSNCVIFLDDGFAEQLKWGGDPLPMMPLFPLRFDSDILSILRVQRPKYLVVLVSSHERNLIHNLKVLAAHSDCCQIVVASLARPPSEEEQQRYAELLATELQHAATVDIYHVQASAIQLLEGSDKDVGVFMLSAPTCRSNAPLSLQRMGLFGADSSMKSVNDILAEDIPPHLRHELKALAVEIASAVVDTLNLDPTGYIYSFGKTASIIGHSIHPLIATAIKDREERQVTAFREKTDLTEASLLIVDRTVDLCTPASTSPTAESSVLARVFATISRQHGEMHVPAYVERPPEATNEYCAERFSMFDVDLQSAALYPRLNESVGTNSSNDDAAQFTLSGLAGLPVQVVPTICKPQSKRDRIDVDIVSQEMEIIWKASLTEPEEETRVLLCDALKRFIESEQGKMPPPKKRGFGAELLALVYSLISSPGGECNTPVNKDRKYNPMVCLKYVAFLSFTASIIDALQRSSSKQFKASFPDLGIWKASFEDRCTYENRWMTECLRRVEAGCPVGRSGSAASFTHALKQEQAIDEVILQELQYRVLSPLTEFKNKGRAVDPVDMLNFFTFIISMASLWGRMPSESCIGKVSAALSEYILIMSPLQELHQTDWISKEVCADILAFREKCRVEFEEETELLKQQLLLELIDTIGNLFTRIVEFIEIPPNPLIQSFARSAELGLNRSGILSQIVRLLLQNLSTASARRVSYESEPSLKSMGVSHVADPLKMLARAGLDFLSYGLNSFGLSSAPVAVKDPEPSDRGVIVIFIIGGLSMIELGQIQREIAHHNGAIAAEGGAPSPRIVLGSNNIICPDDIYRQVYLS